LKCNIYVFEGIHHTKQALEKGPLKWISIIVYVPQQNYFTENPTKLMLYW